MRHESKYRPLAIIIIFVVLLGSSAVGTASAMPYEQGTVPSDVFLPLILEQTPRPTMGRVSIASDGGQADEPSRYPSISADGRYVAFASYASSLGGSDTNNLADVFVHDRQTGETRRVSVMPDEPETMYMSGAAAISANGHFVAFVSDVFRYSDDRNVQPDVFVHDCLSGATERVSVATDGSRGYGWSTEPSISAFGRYVTFTSNVNNLVEDDTNRGYDVFLHDRLAGTTSRISIAADGSQANGESWEPVISADGRHVAFPSTAANLVDADSNGEKDIFVHDLTTHETSRVSVASNGTQSNGSSGQPSISADGRLVAFSSYADNLVPGDTNDALDVFIHDQQTGQTTRISVRSNGGQADGWSDGPSISADGQTISFVAGATNLVDDDTNEEPDIFVHHRTTGETHRISEAVDQTEGDGDSWWPSLSADGRYVAFQSNSSNLVDNDTNGVQDIFVYGSAE